MRSHKRKYYENVCCVAVTVCLLAGLTPILSIAESRVSEEALPECVEFENGEAVTTQQRNRRFVNNKQLSKFALRDFDPDQARLHRDNIPVQPFRERNSHNGIGGFLVT